MMAEYRAMNDYEERARQRGFSAIAGLDEAGRGPLAGPLVVAACVLPAEHPIQGIKDSKQLTARRREILYPQVKQWARSFAIVTYGVEAIEKLNIYRATQEAMMQAIARLDPRPDYILSDAMPLPELSTPVEDLVKGDALSESIAAASILAKDHRDHLMLQIASQYPDYGFEKHKGYASAQHYAALEAFGPTRWHRPTYLRNWYAKQRDQRVGLRGEAWVAEKMEEQGWVILARRKRFFGLAEVDILAKKQNQYVIVEVKTRHQALLDTDLLQLMPKERQRLYWKILERLLGAGEEGQLCLAVVKTNAEGEIQSGELFPVESS